MEQVINFINSTGFPIAVCCYLLKQNRDLAKFLYEFKATINENTSTMKTLISIMKGENK